MDISIILVNYKNAKLTEKCISSVFNATKNIDYEIIVVDNHSEDGSIEYLKEISNIRIIESPVNGGFAYGNNLGVKAAEGEYLLLLNNDTIMKEGMLENLLETMKRDEKIGLLGTRAVNEDGIELPVTHKYESKKRIMLQMYVKPLFERIGLQRLLVDFFENRDSRRQEFTEADWISGSALFIKKDLYYETGGLDENFFMYMEDEDLCHRVKDAGYKVGISSFLGYVHCCGASSKPSYILTKEYIRSRLLYFKRYKRDEFESYRKLLYRQISSYNRALSKEEIKQIKKELDEYILNDIEKEAYSIRNS